MNTLALVPARLVDPLFLVLAIGAFGGALALRPLRSAGARARRGGWAVVFAWALLWLGGTPAIAAALTRALEPPPADEALVAALRDVDPARVAMVVLGGGMREGPPGVPPLERLDGGSAPRATGAARIWQAHRCGTVVVSGASGEEPRDEMAVGMRDLMVALGVPKEIIILEPEAINTRQNATLSMALLRARGPVDHVVVVTTARHMSRSLADFRRAGVEAIGAPVDHQGFAAPGLLGWLPSTSGLWLTGKAVHEMLGRLKP